MGHIYFKLLAMLVILRDKLALSILKKVQNAAFFDLNAAHRNDHCNHFHIMLIQRNMTLAISCSSYIHDFKGAKLVYVLRIN